MTDSPKEYTLNGYTIQAEDLPDDLQEIAGQIGLEALLRLIELRGGEPIYLPKKECIAIAARDRAIVAAFNGRNYRELAHEHGLTVRWVRTIITNHSADTHQQVDKPYQIQLSIV